MILPAAPILTTSEKTVWPWFPKCFDYIRENVLILWWLGFFSFVVSRFQTSSSGCDLEINLVNSGRMWPLTSNTTSVTLITFLFQPNHLLPVKPCNASLVPPPQPLDATAVLFLLLLLTARVSYLLSTKTTQFASSRHFALPRKTTRGKRICCTTSKHINWRSRPLHWTILKARLLSQTAHSPVAFSYKLLDTALLC